MLAPCCSTTHCHLHLLDAPADEVVAEPSAAHVAFLQALVTQDRLGFLGLTVYDQGPLSADEKVVDRPLERQDAVLHVMGWVSAYTLFRGPDRSRASRGRALLQEP